MSKGIKKLLGVVRNKIQQEIIASVKDEGLYARGLSSEGYSAGYRDALDDVILALNGVTPNRRRWWEEGK